MFATLFIIICLSDAVTHQGKASPEKRDDSQDAEDDKNTSGPHFEPIIDLPDLVEVKSGEEEEEVSSIFISNFFLQR